MRIGLQPGNVVDDFGASIECGFGDFELLRVDRDRDFEPPAKAVQNWEHVREFFFRGRAATARTCRFSAHIEQIRPSGAHDQCMLDGAIGIQKFPAVGKAVRCDVQNAHHEGALAENQCARRKI